MASYLQDTCFEYRVVNELCYPYDQKGNRLKWNFLTIVGVQARQVNSDIFTYGEIPIKMLLLRLGLYNILDKV